MVKGTICFYYMVENGINLCESTKKKGHCTIFFHQKERVNDEKD